MFLHTLIQRSSQFVFDLVYPPHCLNCKKVEGWLCQACLDDISFITDLVCERCGTPKPAQSSSLCRQCKDHPLLFIDGIRAVTYFENNPIRPAIHFLKYNNHQVAASMLGKLLIDAYHHYGLKADVIVPVPLHASRVKERGYNQSELLVKEMGRLLDLPVDTHTLQRVRPTKPQIDLGIDERRKNVAEAFACGSQKLREQKILLIDDVCTTGSTLDACAEALKQGGSSSVWGLTLAKAGVGTG